MLFALVASGAAPTAAGSATQASAISASSPEDLSRPTGAEATGAPAAPQEHRATTARTRVAPRKGVPRLTSLHQGSARPAVLPMSREPPRRERRGLEHSTNQDRPRSRSGGARSRRRCSDGPRSTRTGRPGHHAVRGAHLDSGTARSVRGSHGCRGSCGPAAACRGRSDTEASGSRPRPARAAPPAGRVAERDAQPGRGTDGAGLWLHVTATATTPAASSAASTAATPTAATPTTPASASSAAGRGRVERDQ